MKLSGKVLLALPIAIVVGWMNTRSENEWTVAQFLGLGLILFGLEFLSLARIRLDSDSRLREGLVTHGIYSRLRHPVYLFSSLAFAGLLLYLDQSQGLLALLPILLILFLLARKEERNLEATYGRRYRMYKQHTWF